MYKEITAGGRSTGSQLLSSTRPPWKKKVFTTADTRRHSNPTWQQYRCDSHACVQPTVCVSLKDSPKQRSKSRLLSLRDNKKGSMKADRGLTKQKRPIKPQCPSHTVLTDLFLVEVFKLIGFLPEHYIIYSAP